MSWRSAGWRRTLAAIALIVAIAAAIGGATAGAGSLRQDTPEREQGAVVGAVAPGTVAFEFVGRIERRETSVTIYGFLTHVAGLTPEQLFTDPAAPSAETAYFTFFGAADPLPTVEVEGLVVATALGDLAVYQNERAGASFDAAESFFSGTQVANGTARFQDVVLGNPDERRVVDTFAEYTLTDTPSFPLADGSEVQFGTPDTRLFLHGAGLEEPADQDASRTTTDVAGRALVPGATVEIEVTPPPTEEPEPTPTEEAESSPETEETPPPRGTPEAEDGDGDATEEADGGEEGETPPALDVDCDDAEEWLVGSLGRVARVRALVTDVFRVLEDEEADPFADLDPEDLRQAAEELNELATAQQDAEVPDGAEAVDRILDDAFESYARGLNLLASAVDNENDDALAQARTLLDDADQALADGSKPLADLARTCGIRP